MQSQKDHLAILPIIKSLWSMLIDIAVHKNNELQTPKLRSELKPLRREQFVMQYDLRRNPSLIHSQNTKCGTMGCKWNLSRYYELLMMRLSADLRHSIILSCTVAAL